MKSEWFASWFDTSYYHILYKNRDDKEAQDFMDKLIRFLSPTSEDMIMDLACGKGRHAIYLNQKGFQVTGVDLSSESIAHASEFENERLKFDVHDMRKVYSHESFDFLFNLFTSFGYFENESENIDAIQSFAKTLKPGGKLVIDFMNAAKVIRHLVPKESKTIAGITFHISRQVEQGFIVKDIRFNDAGKDFHFTEKVKAISQEDFISYLKQAGLELIKTAGNYALDDFDLNTSDRLILIAQKPL